MLARLDSHADVRLVISALGFAAEAHRRQQRKDGETPYINHPIRLLQVLVDTGGVSDPVLLAAAALHDVVEDCGVGLPEIEARFGTEVMLVVGEVTDDRSLPKAERKAAQVAKAPHLSLRARHLKLADKICNLHDILEAPPANWSNARKAQYFDWAAEVVEGLRGTSQPLEAAFDALMRARPNPGD
jgi:guanosine-3',5'-bis(diphosphate) 3'-pyrophosphohydrolase